MIENLGEVLAFFDDEIEQAEGRALRDHRKALSRAAEIVVDLTPVESGEMAGSWDIEGPGLPGLGEPGPERSDPGKSATIARLQAAAEGAQIGVAGIENVAPHAGFADGRLAIIARAELLLDAELEGDSE